MVSMHPGEGLTEEGNPDKSRSVHCQHPYFTDKDAEGQKGEPAVTDCSGCSVSAREHASDRHDNVTDDKARVAPSHFL